MPPRLNYASYNFNFHSWSLHIMRYSYNLGAWTHYLLDQLWCWGWIWLWLGLLLSWPPNLLAFGISPVCRLINLCKHSSNQITLLLLKNLQSLPSVYRIKFEALCRAFKVFHNLPPDLIFLWVLTLTLCFQIMSPLRPAPSIRICLLIHWVWFQAIDTWIKRPKVLFR